MTAVSSASCQNERTRTGRQTRINDHVTKNDACAEDTSPITAKRMMKAEMENVNIEILIETPRDSPKNKKKRDKNRHTKKTPSLAPNKTL